MTGSGEVAERWRPLRTATMVRSEENGDIGAAVSERNHQQIPHIQAASSGPGISKTNIQRSCVKDPCTPKIEQPLHAHRCPVNSTTLEPCKDGVATSELDNTRSIEHDASSLASAGKGLCKLTNKLELTRRSKSESKMQRGEEKRRQLSYSK
ncbi:hypothetical protein J5N97_012992 [Dioscorea zingiberensis]|uniref:Uncharacterized protein n=1 Tax=Dioscorea zingiberensis TaxID=325984 RepID=A0A9D5CQE9_9LILI|nr:hypothetical protein J5N97_012992 [Dioscorea zingiberensis]